MESATKTKPLTQCPACGCKDLFIRKNFPQKIGLAFVVIAAITFLILSSKPHLFYIGAWVLVGAAVIDGLLYLFVPLITVCYRCRTDFKDFPLNPDHHGFELSIGEKYRTPTK